MPRGTAAASSQRKTAKEVQAAINKKYPGAVRTGDDPMFKIRRIPTGLLAIDARLRGGFARGRYIELYGSSNVGKTAITFNFIATTQAAGGSCSFIDAEGTFDPNFAEAHGVDLAELALTDQNLLEQGNRVIDYMYAQVASQAFDVIVLDSIASLLPKAEFEGEFEGSNFGTGQAKLMSQALRKITSANRDTVIVFINQTRDAVGGSAFAKKTITSGGKAMGFYAGTRIEIVRTENIKRPGQKVNIGTGEITKADQIRGHRLLLKIEKDKTGSAHQGVETTMVYDYQLGGFDYIEDLVYLGREYGLIKKTGSKWSLTAYPDDAQTGRNRFKTWLASDEAVCEELHEAIEQAAYADEDVQQLTDEEDDDAE